MRFFDREVLAMVLLNTRFRLIKFEKLSQGTVNETLAHPREILKPAIIHSAYASFSYTANDQTLGQTKDELTLSEVERIRL
jgi:DNA repair protein RadC